MKGGLHITNSEEIAEVFNRANVADDFHRDFPARPLNGVFLFRRISHAPLGVWPISWIFGE